MGRPKSLENRAELIIEAADELFARYGYERTSIEDIARHLGIGKGSIYIDFRTKDEILALIIKRHADKIAELIQAKVDNCADEPLRAIKEIMIESGLSVYDIVTREMHTPSAMLHTSIQMKGRFSHYFTSKRMQILLLLKKAAKLKQIAAGRATDETAMAIVASTSGLFPPYVNNYSEADTRIDRETLIKRTTLIVDLLIEGLKK